MRDWSTNLDRGERILWVGRPSRRLFLFRMADIFLVPLSIFWTGSVSYFAFISPPGIAYLFIAPFILAGLHIMIGRFFVDAYIRRKIEYTLTNQRALILRSAFGQRLREHPVRPDTPITVVAGRRAAITFGALAPANDDAANPWLAEDGSFTFRALDNAEEVYGFVRRIQSGDL